MDEKPARPPHWPPNVEPLVIEDFGKLGRDPNNQLFWDGKRLKTQYEFTSAQIILAILAAIASLATIATGINNASVFLCGRGSTLLGCPPQLAPASVPAVVPVPRKP
jgi:hypothetical protein